VSETFHFDFSFLRGLFQRGDLQRGQYFGGRGERVIHLLPHRSQRHSRTCAGFIATIMMMIITNGASVSIAVN
jgi:hypothetical protein